ncbi:MAG: phospholipase D family protein, partial [Candidatus Lindowbacteria bacterium]|nr:phospholipase D family protein [Candidatus Lindowbacteria bacterium]
MSKQKEQKPGYGKILDAWIPPKDAGDPIGCVVTSFTFEPELFEEECLGRFLQLETNATEDGPAYLVEREEKLSQLECAAALVDQHHARGVRSLRWDLLPARLPRGILHAKVSLLLWSRYARLIVASANLTKGGYRRNHEVFGVLDYFAGSGVPLGPLAEITGFLLDAVHYADPAGRLGSAAIRRWNVFLGRVSRVTRDWGAAKSPPTIAKPHCFSVVTGPGRPSALDTLREQWPDNSPPNEAFVVSPFFDPPEVPNAPARELWALLKQRGEATVEFDVTA